MTSSDTYAQARRAKAILDGLHGAYHIVRGSHDRPGQHPAQTRGGAADDCLAIVFFPGARRARASTTPSTTTAATS